MSERGPVEVEPGLDFALAAYREEGVWQLDSVPPTVAADLDGLVAVLRGRPGDNGAIGLVSVGEDFFLLVRVVGGRVRMLLSDVTAATDWPLAHAVLDALDLPLPDDDDEQVQPAGDLSILADLGLDALTLAAICDDIDLYPEELLGDIAARLGFGDEYEELLDTLDG